MKKILVSGLVNIETSVSVDSFPIYYSPVEYPFFGVNSCVSGVGFNVTKALKTLGSEADLLSEVGDDIYLKVIKEEMEKNNIDTSHLIVFEGKNTAESVVFVEKSGERKIYCDLKDIQERPPLTTRNIDFKPYSLAVLTNINFNRKLLKVAKEKDLVIATDVHVLYNIEDDYNEDFLESANILFLSNEGVYDREADFIKALYDRYHNDIIVIGCGEQGALMYIGKEAKYIYEPAVAPKGVKSTVGAGDALFSAFIHFYNKGCDPKLCLKYAVRFAGMKISESGGSNGFVNEEELIGK